MTTPRTPRRFRGPCRTGTGPRVHHCSPFHADQVEGYRSWRDYELELAEAATQQYATELADYWSTHRAPTFRHYLTHH